MSRHTSVSSCKEKPICPSCNFSFAIRDAVHLMGARSKCPMILLCGHTVCLGCLRSSSRLQRAFRCPICLQDTDIPDNRNWKQLLINYHILGILCANRMQDVDASFVLKLVPNINTRAAASALALETEVCTECGNKIVAFECVQCERLMCKKCFREVHESKDFSGHFVKPVLSAGNHPLLICKEHDKIRDFYCNDDKEVICANCALVGAHKGHDVTLVSEKNKTCLTDVKGALESARKIVKCLKSSEKALKELLADAEKETRSSAMSIRKQFLSLHAALQLRENALFEELSMRANRQSKTMQEMLDNLEKSYHYLQAVISDAEAQLENPSRLVNPDWLENLACIENLPCFLQVSEEERRRMMKKFSPKTVVEDSLFSQLLNCASLNDGEEDSDEEEIRPTLATLSRVSDDMLDEMPDEEDRSSMPDLEALNDTDDASVLSQESGGSTLMVSMTATNREVQYRRNWRQKGMSSKPRPQPLRDLKIKPRKFNVYKQELVRVVHIISPNEFYVHRHADAHTLRQLEDGISQYCRRKKCSTPPIIEKGGVYLALFETDRKWYRACVRDILNSEDASEIQDEQNFCSPYKGSSQENGLKDMVLNVEVEYIDYGNQGVVKSSQLLPLPEELSQLPTMALKCTLWQIEPVDKENGWSKEAIKMFMKFVATDKKLVEMTVLDQIGDVLHIDLGNAEQSDSPSPTPLSVREALVFLEFGHFPCPELSLDCDTRHLTNRFDVFYDYLSPAQNESFEVLVSHIVNAEDFYVQKWGECNNHLTSLMFQMKEMYSSDYSMSPLSGPSVGMPCAALYSDGQWYRAEITALKSGKALEVFYVDYGNRETISYTKVKRLHTSFLKLSKMALHCKLADIKLKSINNDTNVDITKDAYDFFRTEVYMKVLKLVVEDTSEKPLSVSLYRVDEDETEGLKEVCLNAEMVTSGYAISTGPCSNKPSVRILKVHTQPLQNSMESSKVGQNGTLPQNEQNGKLDYNIEVHISHIESPDCIFVQLVNKDDALKSLMKNLLTVYNQSKADTDCHWDEEAFCIALNPSDKCWYRGKINSINTNDACEVFFFDYGEKHIISKENLRPILDKFLKEPEFAFPCRLTGIVASGGSNKWPALAIDHLQELSSKYDTVHLKTMGPVVDGVLPVSLYAEEVTVASALEPTVTTYLSFAERLIDQGLALPTERRSKSKQNGLSSIQQQQESRERSEDVTASSLHSDEIKEVSTSVDQLSLDKTLTMSNWSKKWKPVQFTAQAGYKFKAVPTYVNHGASIYLHDNSMGATILQFIQTTLKDRFDGTVPQSHDLYWFKGQACIAQFALDNLWYRAEVLDVRPNEIDVLFIDYGNVDTVRPDQLRKDIILTDIAQQAILCDLYNIVPNTEDGKWPVKIVEFLHKLIVETLCEVTVMVPPREDQNMKISLTVLPDANVEKTLVEINYARFLPKDDEEPDVYITEESDVIEIQPSYEELGFPPIAEIIQVTITEITGPDMFYIQRMKNSDMHTDYQNDINEHCEMLMCYTELMNTCAKAWATIENPKIGQPCCARYTDDSWFRAVVTDVNEENSTVVVSYVDYGNVESVDNESIRELPDELLKLPKQAILCKLHQVAPVTSWTAEIEEKMRRIFEIADGSLFVLIKDFDNPVSVDLLRSEERTLSSSSTELAYQSLIDEGLIRMVREKTSEELL